MDPHGPELLVAGPMSDLEFGSPADGVTRSSPRYGPSLWTSWRQPPLPRPQLKFGTTAAAVLCFIPSPRVTHNNLIFNILFKIFLKFGFFISLKIYNFSVGRKLRPKSFRPTHNHTQPNTPPSPRVAPQEIGCTETRMLKGQPPVV